MDARQEGAAVEGIPYYLLWVDRDTEPHVRTGPAQVGREKESTSSPELDDKGVVTGDPGTHAAPESRLEGADSGREV